MSVPLWVHLFRVVVGFAVFLTATALLIWAERRIVARMQSRLGPNRVGPFGVLQTLVDGVKLFFKEPVTPGMVDRPTYLAAPLISVVVAFLTFAVLPFGGSVTLFGETFPLQIADPDIGALWFLAMGSLNVYAVVLAGWASRSAYPLLGGVRSSAQMISYEIAQGLAVAAVFIYAGTLRVSEIVAIQATGPGLVRGLPNWFAIPLLPAFLMFAIAAVAETQRPPFDLPEAEGELVAGFHTEYSGLRFAMFFLAEFMNTITVSGIMATLFLGGPAGPNPLDGSPATAWILPVAWFWLKTGALVFVFILLRATLPRMRYDRLMDLGWRWMLPLGLVWVLATGTMIMVNERLSDRARFTVAAIGVAAAAVLYVLAPMLSPRSRRPEEVSR